MDEAITFLASFPPIQSAIKINGGNDGARIQLDIAESDIAQAARLLLVRGKVIRVTIVLEPETLTELDADATQEETKRGGASLDLRRSPNRRD